LEVLSAGGVTSCRTTSVAAVAGLKCWYSSGRRGAPATPARPRPWVREKRYTAWQSPFSFYVARAPFSFDACHFARVPRENEPRFRHVVGSAPHWRRRYFPLAQGKRTMRKPTAAQWRPGVNASRQQRPWGRQALSMPSAAARKMPAEGRRAYGARHRRGAAPEAACFEQYGPARPR